MKRNQDESSNLSATAAILHIVVILIAYSSPWWLDWRIVAVGVLAYYLQILIFKGCVLSLAQFKGEKKSFHEWYLTKLGLRVNRRKLRFFLDVILPPLFPIVGYIIQMIIGYRPYLFL